MDTHRAAQGSEGSAGNGGVVVATTELEGTTSSSEDALKKNKKITRTKKPNG